MNAWPEAAAIARFLVRVRRRMIVLRALEGVAVGLAVAVLLAIGGVRSIAMLTTTVLALAIVRVALGDQWRFGWWRSLPQIAQRLERRTQKPRNLLVTASELLGGTRSYVNDAVMARASDLVSDLDLGALFPARRALAGAGIAAFAFTVVLMRPTVVDRVVQVILFGASGPGVRRVYVTVIP